MDKAKAEIAKLEHEQIVKQEERMKKLRDVEDQVRLEHRREIQKLQQMEMHQKNQATLRRMNRALPNRKKRLPRQPKTRLQKKPLLKSPLPKWWNLRKMLQPPTPPLRNRQRG